MVIGALPFAKNGVVSSHFAIGLFFMAMPTTFSLTALIMLATTNLEIAVG
jgi:hypothetical protein